MGGPAHRGANGRAKSASAALKAPCPGAQQDQEEQATHDAAHDTRRSPHTRGTAQTWRRAGRTGGELAPGQQGQRSKGPPRTPGNAAFSSWSASPQRPSGARAYNQLRSLRARGAHKRTAVRIIITGSAAKCTLRGAACAHGPSSQMAPVMRARQRGPMHGTQVHGKEHAAGGNRRVPRAVRVTGCRHVTSQTPPPPRAGALATREACPAHAAHRRPCATASVPPANRSTRRTHTNPHPTAHPGRP